MANKLLIADFIQIGEAENRDFEKHRRHQLHSASSEQLLSLKLELHEVINILELYSRADNSVSCWYHDKLLGLEAVLIDVALAGRKSKGGWK